MVTTTKTIIRSYEGLLKLHTFEERFQYLSLRGNVGRSTFGLERYLNQAFYTSRQWKDVRHIVIARDEGRDLAMPGYEIYDKVIIHHIKPMTIEDIEDGNPLILDPDNLITTSHDTHNAIHYGTQESLKNQLVERRPGDTKLW